MVRICLEISRLVSETLAEVTARALADTGQNRLVVASGETSAAVCARLGINGMHVWKEISTWTAVLRISERSIQNACPKIRQLWQTDFFERALEHLKES